jgi:hypothetical protein
VEWDIVSFPGGRDRSRMMAKSRIDRYVLDRQSIIYGDRGKKKPVSTDWSEMQGKM